MLSANTNFYKNIILIVLLVVALFYQRDESQVVDNNALDRQETLSEDYQKGSYEYRVHLGFIERSERRLQKSRNDSRQL
ncbi:hypothetical protein [Flagellimonas sp. MMG031]|jgi:hypothetical protein|uniref:Secreted protein n=1 Tax=Flagellimonas sp. MMG031 TaxID=3158549 RepID=A0AAU7MVK1_9FLAO